MKTKLILAASLALVATQIAAAGTAATNGATLAFTSLRGGTAALYVAGPDGSAARRLTAVGAGAYQGDASWSPDGSRLVFTCGNYELCVANADGSGVARLTTSLWPRTWSYDFEPTWSPDGTKVVFSGKRGSSSFDLWVVDADGTGLRRLLDTATEERLPDWSPDGTKIAYAAEGDLHVVNADGSSPRPLTASRAVFENDPDWSPDGATIAYERIAESGDRESHIWLMSAAGSGQRALTRGAGEEEPSWTPDGGAVLFSAPVGTNDDLFSIRADGSGRVRLVSAPGGDYNPQLQPAGVTVALPALPAGAPGAVQRDARVVGVFLARSVQLDRDLVSVDTSTVKGLLAGGRALMRDGAAGRRALAATKPVSIRARRVRTEGMAAFDHVHRAGRDLIALLRFSGTGPKAAQRRDELRNRFVHNLEQFERRLDNAVLEAGF